MGSKLDNALGFYLDGVRDGLLEPALDKYVSDKLIQHSVGVADCRSGLFGAYAPRIAKHASREIAQLVGNGNFVAALCRIEIAATTYAVIDLFRADAGQISERWDVACEAIDNGVNRGAF
jgi:predicted SnoaL-like aldol condensation-catalyzing enzyme